MAKIECRTTSNGETRYRAHIRMKGKDISCTFSSKKDAELWAKYKENLIENMANFDVPLKNRITLAQIFELKYGKKDEKTLKHVAAANKKLQNAFYKLQFPDEKKWYTNITYEDWVRVAEELLKEKGKTGDIVSLSTVRNTFAYASSAVSYVQSLGIDIDNMPMKVLQTKIAKLKKSKDNLSQT